MTTPTLRAPAADMVVPLDIAPGGLDLLLTLFGDRPNPLVKYRNGKVLLVSPGEDHERAVQRLDVLLLAVCTALRIDLRGYRSTLFRKPGLDHGVMPDLTYYVRNAPAVRGVRGKIDLTAHPPPDLAVEVIVTHGVELALEVCRELGVPELWTYDVVEGRMTFRHRRRSGPRAGEYVERERSLAFPFLRAADLPPWLEDTDAADNAEFVRMQRWARTTLAPCRKPGGRP
jgi:Uma2 family endonuclease